MADTYFDYQRKRVEQGANAAGQQQQEALQRRFAAMGNLNSGASIKAQQQTAQEVQKQKDTALEGIGAQEAQYNQAKQEAQTQREFAAQEAEKQRGFAGGESEKERAFRSSQADIDRAFQDKVFQFDKSNKLAQLDLAKGQFDLDKMSTEFNKAISLASLDDFDSFKKALAQLNGQSYGGGGLSQGNIWNLSHPGFQGLGG